MRSLQTIEETRQAAAPVEAPAPGTGPSPGRTRGGEDVTRRLLIWVSLYSLPLLAVLDPISDADIWWHLRTGEWVLDHRTVPATDPFSSYGLGKPWVAYSWLFGVSVYTLYSWLGLAGIILCRTILLLTVAVAVHRLVA